MVVAMWDGRGQNACIVLPFFFFFDFIPLALIV